MKLIMKNYEVNAFGQFLYHLKLKGSYSRMRSRFISILNEQINLIDKEREILLEDYARKDGDGNIVTQVGEDGASYVVLEDAKSYNIEMAKLMSEEFIVDITDNNKEIFKALKDIVLECDLEFSGDDAERYERFCEIVEQYEIP